MITTIKFKSWRHYEVEDASQEDIEALIRHEGDDTVVLITRNS